MISSYRPPLVGSIYEIETEIEMESDIVSEIEREMECVRKS